MLEEKMLADGKVRGQKTEEREEVRKREAKYSDK